MSEILDRGTLELLPVGDAAGADVIPEEMVQTVEAILFAAHEPLLASTLAPSLNGSAVITIDRIVIVINQRLSEGGHPMRVRKVAGGYQMYVLPEFGPAIEAALIKTKIQRLSRAGLETLAIIAYKQPCSTPEIERIRGVSCGGVLNTLLERDLISIAGRSDGPGRPLLYGTSREFLRHFGLNSIDDLPRIEELERLMAERGSAFAFESNPESLAAIRGNVDDCDEVIDNEEVPGRLIIKHAPESLLPESAVSSFRITGIVAQFQPDGDDGGLSGNCDEGPTRLNADQAGWAVYLRTD